MNTLYAMMQKDIQHIDMELRSAQITHTQILSELAQIVVPMPQMDAGHEYVRWKMCRGHYHIFMLQGMRSDLERQMQHLRAVVVDEILVERQRLEAERKELENQKSQWELERQQSWMHAPREEPEGEGNHGEGDSHGEMSASVVANALALATAMGSSNSAVGGNGVVGSPALSGANRGSAPGPLIL